MTLLNGALSMGRAQAVARFTETFKAFTESQVLDESTGLYATTETAVYTDVPGRIKFPSLNVSELNQGGQVPAVQEITIHVAVGSTPNVVVNTLWRCTGSTVDPSLVGRVFRAKGLPQAGQVTAWRYPVESAA